MLPLLIISALIPSLMGGSPPWEVGLRRAGIGDRLCGGALVNARFVLTAAGCVDGLRADDVRVRTGDPIENLRNVIPSLDNKRQSRAGWEDDAKIKEIFVHPDYDASTGTSDIALLELEEELELIDGEVWPICLSDDLDNTYEGRFASQRGWGTQSVLFGPHQTLLPPGNLVVMANDECGVDGSQMCSKNGFFHFESCTADRGGPLSVKEFNVDTQEILVGIVTSNDGCPTNDGANSAAAKPAVYTRLTPHYDWLLEVTRGTAHCLPTKIFKDHHRRRLVAANRVD